MTMEVPCEKHKITKSKHKECPKCAIPQAQAQNKITQAQVHQFVHIEHVLPGISWGLGV